MCGGRGRGNVGGKTRLNRVNFTYLNNKRILSTKKLLKCMLTRML